MSKVKRKKRQTKAPERAEGKKFVVQSKETGWKAAVAELNKRSLVQSNVKLSMLVLIVMYFLLDYMMMTKPDEMSMVAVVIFTMLAPSMLYSYYVSDCHKGLFPKGGTDMPAFVKNKKKYAIIGWAVITVWSVIFLIAEPFVVPRLFKLLDETYHSSQLALMVVIAPIMEEIIFRYLLYDRWLRKKWGWFWGFVAASIVFVVCHPITNTHALVIYWVPTLLFFLVYHEFGMYGSIIMHMIYNIMAL